MGTLFKYRHYIYCRKSLKALLKYPEAKMAYNQNGQNQYNDQNQYNNQFYNQNNFNQPPPPPPVDYNNAPPPAGAPAYNPQQFNQPKVDTAPQTNYQFQSASNTEANHVWSLNNFSDRQAFIKKVYFTLSIQLLITFIPIILCGIFVDDNYTPSNGLFWSAWALQLVAFFMLCCGGQTLARKFPTNIIFLVIFTLAETYLLTV